MLLFGPTGQQNAQDQGLIEGTVVLYEGNCMPSPNAPPCKPFPVVTTVFISKPSEVYQKALLIDSLQSDQMGKFNAQLPPGQYSLFVRDQQEIICDVINCPDECFCHLIEIKPNQKTETVLKIDHASW